MIAIFCALLRGGAFYASTNVGAVWPLAWLAPVPVLWLAFGPAPRWQVAAAAFFACALGALNLVVAYGSALPWFILAIALIVPSFFFALSVMGARFVRSRLHWIAGAAAFALLWTAWDYLLSLGANGAAESPAL